MNIQNQNLFSRLNKDEMELLLWILNVAHPTKTEVTIDNIFWYRLTTLKNKLTKTKKHIKEEYSHMYGSIYDKLELEKVDDSF